MARPTVSQRLGPTLFLPPFSEEWQALHFLNTFLPAAASAAGGRLALVLAMDVSSSVDAEEAKTHQPNLVFVDSENKVSSLKTAETHQKETQHAHQSNQCFLVHLASFMLAY